MRPPLPVQILITFLFGGAFVGFGRLFGECLFLCFAGTLKRYIFAAGTYKVGRKGASLDLPLRFFCGLLLLIGVTVIEYFFLALGVSLFT